jgi:hypothetical protein
MCSSQRCLCLVLRNASFHDPEVEGSTYFRNVGKILPCHTTGRNDSQNITLRKKSRPMGKLKF